MRYRRKPTEVDARQVVSRERIPMGDSGMHMLAGTGDWIVTEVKTGETTILSDRTFKKLYEVVK